MAGIDPDSDGLARARERGHTVTHRGPRRPARSRRRASTSPSTRPRPRAHPEHARLLAERGIRSVDLTPAALGPAVVPPVNLVRARRRARGQPDHVRRPGDDPDRRGDQPRRRACRYAETVSTVVVALGRARARGQNIDEFTQRPRAALETIGGAPAGQGDHHPEPGRPADHDAQHDLRRGRRRRRRPRSRRRPTRRWPPSPSTCPGYRLTGRAAGRRRPRDRDGRGRGRRRLPAALRRQPRHHDLGRGPRRRAARAGRRREHARGPHRRHDPARRVALDRAPVPHRAGAHDRGGARPRPACGRSRSATATASAPTSLQYGLPLHSDAELLRGGCGRGASAPRSRSRCCRGSAPSATSRRPATPARRWCASRPCAPRPTSALQHLTLARELGMAAHSHLNTAHLLDRRRDRRGGADRRRRGQHRRLHRRLGRRVPARRRAPPDRGDARRRCPTTSPSASTSTTTSRSPSPTRPRRSRRARRSSTPRSPASAPAPATARPRRSSPCSSGWASRPAIDLWALQDVADDFVRAELMHAADRDRPADGDDGLRGRARELPAARDPRRRALRRSIRARSSSSSASAASSSARRTRSSASPPSWQRRRARAVITVVLDDDPTGTQAVSDVLVVLDWSDPGVWDGVRADERAVHVLTNSRAHTRRRGRGAGRVGGRRRPARGIPRRAARPARRQHAARRTCGRSTTALRAVVARGRAAVPLLLVPALPAAGRVTIGGVHLTRARRRARAARRDRVRPRRRPRLLRAPTCPLGRRAQRRPARGGRRRARPARAPAPRRPGRTTSPRRSRAAAALGRPGGGDPRRRDRCRPAHDRARPAGRRGGAHRGHRPLRAGVRRRAHRIGCAGLAPRRRAAIDGVLVLCGSFVRASTAQLEALAQAHPGAAVAADVRALAGDAWSAEVDRLAEAARERIERLGLAVVATGRVARPRRWPIRPASGGLRRRSRRSPAGCAPASSSPRAASRRR